MAHRLHVEMGMKQNEVAAKMTAEGYPMDQGTVSRLVSDVRDYLNAGNKLPAISSLNSQPQAMNPTTLDMGKRQDSLTPRQRLKKTDDSDE
jgi:hypothetical protein